jgi:hypothetical protein
VELTTTPKKPRQFIYLGLLPVSLFLFLVIGLWLFPPSLRIFEPEFLLPALNSFLFLTAAIIAIIALRSYLLSGSSTVLWFGCGVLTLGTGAVSMDIVDIQNLFSPQTEINLFRVFQEALNNTAKHAQASEISVNIKRQDGRVNFFIKDNGVGFDLEQIAHEDRADKGMGIASMEERLRMIGSRLNIVSQTGRGTEVSFSIPCDANSQERKP